MFVLISLLSLSRVFLAFLFLSDNFLWRLLAVTLALITDGLDGYLARRYQKMSQFGAIIDPVADKFFVLVALAVLSSEGRLSVTAVLMLLTRDFAVAIFAVYLWLSSQLSTYRIRATVSGKITTVLQAGVLLLLIFQISLPTPLYFLFPLLGIAAFAELCWSKNKCLLS